MTPAELLAKHSIALENTAPGRYYVACPRCSKHRRKPGHKDAKCLGVTIEADGRVYWGCNHCGWSGPKKGSGERQPLTTYKYCDADGAPRFRKVRNLPGRKPRFWLEQPDEGARGGWRKGTKGVDTKILYHAQSVVRAITDGRCIAIAEGEKDVDNLRALGIAATCNAHGASEPGKQPKWMKAHSEQLRDADIVVFNDNDAAGYEHADTVCRLSLGIAKRVRRLDLKPHWQDMPRGADISDWLALGHTREELDALIAAAPVIESEPGPPREPEPTDADIEIARLAQLTPMQYEQERKAAAEKLSVRSPVLDRLVAAERAQLGLDDDDGKQGHAILFPEPEPWPEPVDGASLLNALAAAIRKHIVMSAASSHAAALWILHAWLVD